MISEKKPNEDSTFRENVARTNASADETGTDDATLTGTLGHGNVPEVDTQYASTIKVSKLKGKWLMWMVTIVAGTGFTLFGYDQGVVSGILTLPSFEATFPQTAGVFGAAATLQSLLIAIYELGCMAGALCNLYVGDRIGRIKTIILASTIMIIGAILQAASVNYAMILVARVVSGVGNGLLTSTIPAYQSECAPPEKRGQLVLVSGSLITFGIMIAYWLNVGFFFPASSVSWRFPLAFQIVFILVMLFCIVYFQAPESPRWLAKKGRHAECLATLAALRDTTVDDPEILKTFRGICDVLAAEDQGAFAFKEMFTNGKAQNFRRTMIGMLSQWFQQITGINLITYYLTSVLQQQGLSPLMSRVISGVNGTCYFLTSLIAIAIIERAGRRPLMLWTALAQGITMVILAGLYNKVEEGNRVAQGFSVLMLFLFNTWFSIGWLGITWLYPAEVTPLRVRAPANALSTATNWIGNFFVVMATGPMFANIRYGTYIFFAVMNLFWVLPGTYFLFPETKNRSLEELDIIFAMGHEQNKSPVWISTKGDIPEAGSPEAQRILGRQPGKIEMGAKAGEKPSAKRTRSQGV